MRFKLALKLFLKALSRNPKLVMLLASLVLVTLFNLVIAEPKVQPLGPGDDDPIPAPPHPDPGV